jgi:PilZ domain
MDRMKNLPYTNERRRFGRLLLDLPLDYRVASAPYTHGGLVVNASEAGLLIQSIKSIPIGTRLLIAILFPRGFELTRLDVLAEVIWKDLYWEEDREGFHYGLRFVQILPEERGKLRQLLAVRFHREEELHSS